MVSFLQLCKLTLKHLHIKFLSFSEKTREVNLTRSLEQKINRLYFTNKRDSMLTTVKDRVA